MKFPPPRGEKSDKEDNIASPEPKSASVREQRTILNLQERKRKGKQVMQSLPKKGKGMNTKGEVRKSIQVPYERVSDKETESEWENQEEGAEEKEEGREFPIFGKMHIQVDKNLQAGMEKFTHEKLQAGYQRRKEEQKQMKSGKKLHEASLNALGIKDKYFSYLSAVGFEWLLELDNSDVLANLALEFFTSFTFTHNTDLDERAISFRVYDRTFYMSLNEWSVHLGLYTVKEAIAGIWRERDMGLPRLNANFSAQEAWRSLTHEKEGKFKPSQSKGFHISDHTLRFAQVYLSHNLLANRILSPP